MEAARSFIGKRRDVTSLLCSSLICESRRSSTCWAMRIGPFKSRSGKLSFGQCRMKESRDGENPTVAGRQSHISRTA
jgi:hypothetical protein